ncbi:regulatory LuxR family protein [Ulvibacter sp. MAR_2010_11]|uniref:helix-turn-helix domain-containing protein n=1 Tax=Ulvibacter sp. MAR_2010_11 TaxID=1250229 RepID=UPI000C2B5F14|nr:LuxR C-terminal-related transcriptional regulator [Ulvibacter sp. MAR_2010_11]PKA83399.1 regulatory LuxR family protein [Ulvibacter sp. MAR_2010_11]
MKKYTLYLTVLFCLLSFFCNGQYSFSGYVDTETSEGVVYLSVVDDYRKISGVYPEQILAKAIPDSTGFFLFTGNNLPTENKMYRIHVDTCTEEAQNITHFNGHCPNSREVIFIANNNDTLSLPFSFDNEIFCRVVSKNEKANAFLKIDSLKHDMRFAFGTYRSEANRQINSKKWFSIFQQYGEQLHEPLAELYSYAFLSDRTNSLHSYYLEDLKTNNYYDNLLERLRVAYPNSTYVAQYKAELTSDKYLVSAVSGTESTWWLYLLGAVCLLSIFGNVYFFRKLKKVTNSAMEPESPLSSQEKKVLDLILEDKTNKEIANQLFLSVSTVKTHINNLYKKLHVNSREEVKLLFASEI